MSVGLFGAYTGNPRLQRAYASGCTIANSVVATTDDSLIAALDDSSVTCIGIQGTINLTQDLPRISHSKWNGSARESLGLTILGSGDDTINGASTYSGIRLFLDDSIQTIAGDAELNISNLSLTNFDTPNTQSYNSIGNAIYAYMYQQPHDLRVTLQGVHVSNNVSLLQGGALYAGTNADDTVASSVYTTIVDSTFSNNTGGVHGGAVMVSTEDDTAVLNVSGSTFDSNNVAGGQFSTYAYGGALSVRARNQASGVAKAIVGPDSRFYQNSSTGSSWSYGGAIYVSNFLEISGSVDDTVIFHDNAADAGGAIHIAKIGGGTAEHVTFYDNTAAKGNGGAVSNYGTGPLSFSAVTVSDNSAVGLGGGIHSKGLIEIHDGSTFERNMATGPQSHGGAIFTESSLTVTGSAARPVVFADDSASKFGGAVYAKYGTSTTSAVFSHNTAESGGAIYNWDGPLTIYETTVSDNTALDVGGGIYSCCGAARLENSSVTGNTAYGADGGGLYIGGNLALLTVENSFIGNNSVGSRGGGIFMKDNGDVDLRFSTVYDDTVSAGGTAPEIWAGSITSTMSVVGSRTTRDIWEFTGTLDDTSSVSTADDTQFGINLEPGALDFGNLTGAAPGELGRTPNADSPLALAPQDGHAPLVNPLPGTTTDQRGFARVAPFTIGARQALTINSVTPSSGDSTGGELITIHGSAFTGATTAAIGGAAVTNLIVVDDTTITGTAPAGTVGTADVTVSDTSGTATLPNSFTFVAPNPNPPAPTPSVPASTPREVRAEAAVESAKVSWLPPASTGSFPVTSYQAVASPGGQTCMISAPALTCTITGLTPGKPYTVTARALTGAGWSEASSPSSVVVPLGPEVPTILITNSRDRAQKSMARIEGTTTGLVGAEVVPYLRMAGQAAFTPRASTRTVDADGNFAWQRKAKKRFTVYFVSGDVTSNRLVIRPE